MQEVEFSQANRERRRSERIANSVPLIVRGLDLLGQPFEERTSTQILNLHGCRYSSKHHLPKNAWVTLGFHKGSEFRSIRARVAWLEPPHSIRETFAVGVELESPGNAWGIEFPPESWMASEVPSAGDSTMAQQEAQHETGSGQSEAKFIPFMIGTPEANAMADTSGYSAFPEGSGFSTEGKMEAPEQSPLVRDLAAELRRQANQAIESAAAQAAESMRRAADENDRQRILTAEEFFQKWKENLDQAQTDARSEFSAQLSARQEEFLAELKSQFERRFTEANEVLQELEDKAHRAAAAHAELTGVGSQTAVQNESEQRSSGEQPNEADEVQARWNQRLDLEMSLAQAQFHELLQSSLDGSIVRLASQIAEHSQEVLRSAEQRLASRFAELRQPLAETSAETRDALNRLRSDLEREMAQARESMAEIEHVASRLKDYSGQLEASTHDALNELHRRLENILDGQTREMTRHADGLVAGMWDRLNPAFDALGNQLVERVTSEAESRLSPHAERVTGLIHDLSAREMQTEESLRLHRERLRQLAENNLREAAAQMGDVVSSIRDDFEGARRDAIGKWNEEVAASGARSAQAVSESIGQSSEWFQNEARARLQVAVEQALATAQSNCEAVNSESAQKFAEEADNRTKEHLQEIQRQLEGAGSDVAGRTRSTLDEAAAAAAASFGQLLQNIAGTEAESFVHTSRNVICERTQELERSAQDALGRLASGAEASVEGFRQRMASELEASAAEGRHALARELTAMLERFGNERGAREEVWAQGLDRISQEAAERHQDRLQNACDAWLVSSVRRLNEHGQNVVESLMRSTDQAVRDSCAQVFEGLANSIRGRSGGNTGFPGFVQASGREVNENPPAQ